MMHLINFNKLCLSRLCVSSLRHKLTSMRSITTIDDNYDEQVLKSDRIFEDLTRQKFESLAQNEKQLNEIELILSQYEHTKYSSLEVPSTLTTDDMKQLLSLDTYMSRNRYLNYLFKKEMTKLLYKKKRSIDKKLKQAQLSEKWSHQNIGRSGLLNNDGQLVYGLWHNSMFTRISKQNLRHYAMHRLRGASLFGQNIVFDFSFQKQLSQKDCNLIVAQINDCYTFNRYRFSEPFNLHFCNIDYNSLIWQTIEKKLPMVKTSHFYVNCTHKSYLDLFEDKTKLVYISSKAEKSLDFDHNCVYILGAINEKSQSQPIVTIKAKQENIEVRKMPFDKHVLWNSGPSKILRLSNVLSILNDIKDGLKWPEAIHRNVPQSFIKTPEMIAKEEMLKLEKIRNRLSIKRSNKLDVSRLLEN